MRTDRLVYVQIFCSLKGKNNKGLLQADSIQLLFVLSSDSYSRCLFSELNLDFYDVIKWQLGSSDAFMSGAVGVICSHHDNVFKCRGDITESRARDCVGFLIVHALPLDFLTVITLLHIVTCRLGN